ncbi:MAG: DUF3099 domain-containing protein [Micropruina sp.]|nr:DUF3099 domain-containing protein [Micropruina sp.]
MPKSLDAVERNKRYAISMVIRVFCFLGGCFTPSPWNWVLFAGAALIPAVAVVLANLVDLRAQPNPTPSTEPLVGVKELPGGDVLVGTVED